MKRSRIIRCPEDILMSLKKEYPNSKNPEIFRKIHEDHIQFKMIEKDVHNAGVLLYGRLWERKYGKKK